MRSMFVALSGLLAVACTGKPAEAPVRSVASPTPGPVPYRASPSAAQSPYVAAAPSAVSGGASSSYAPATFPANAAPQAPAQVRWYENIAEAQNEARASGKLILVGSTKPGCSLCDKFAHQIAPQCWSRLSQVAVPYMYDIVQYDTKVSDNVRVDRALRTNLRGAALMPLVGFLTPDLQWVHGFSGPRSVAEFMGDIESARRIYPVHAAALPQPAPLYLAGGPGAPTAPAGGAFAQNTGPAVTVVNEFGEREWSTPAEWPAPEDALGPVAKLDVTTPEPTPTPAPLLAGGPGAPPAVVASTSAMVEAAPAPAPAPEPTPAPVVASTSALVEPAPASASDPAWSEPVAVPRNLAVSSAPIASAGGPGAPSAAIASAGGPGAPSAPMAMPAQPAPVAAPTAGPVTVLTPASGAMSASDADGALRAAHAAIRAGQFDEAKAGLRRVSQTLPNTAAGREADRGAVAVYNARKIAVANADQRPALVERAKKDLGATMWADLF